MRRHPLCLLVLLLLLAPRLVAAETTHLRLLHINDLHGFAEPSTPLGEKEPLGGAAALAGKIKALRQGQPTVFLAAGDIIQGHNWTNLDQGAPAIALLNLMGCQAMALGNHEFDFGQETLERRLNESRFPWLAANVSGLGGVKPYTILEVDGTRVGVIGVVTADTPVATHPKNVVGLTFSQPVEAVRHLLPEVRDKADLVVVLAHLGHEAERQLAEEVPGIDIVIGGHSHTKVTAPPTIGTTLVAQAWEHGKALGVIDVTLEENKPVKISGRLEEIRPQGVSDPKVSALVARQSAKVEELLGMTVGTAASDLDGEHVRRQETNLGNYVADVIRKAAGAEAAMINGGSLRTSIHQGKVAVRDIYAALPFDNYIVAISLSGDQIRAALEHGVSAVERGEGRFPQVSGLAFTYDPNQPAGSRVGAVLVNGAPLESGRSYSVATNDFLAAGGDGYQAFGDALKAGAGFASTGGALTGNALVFSDPGHFLRDIVVQAWQAAGTIAPQAEGRIRVVKP